MSLRHPVWETWLLHMMIHVRNMTLWHERHDSLTWKTWLIHYSFIWWLLHMIIHVKNMTHLHGKHDSFIPHWFERHDSLIWKTWRSHALRKESWSLRRAFSWLVDMGDMTQSYLKKCIVVLETCVFEPPQLLDFQHLRHDSLIWGTWLIHKRDMTYLHERRDTHMGWLWLVGSLKYRSLLQNIGLFCRALLQKRPVFLGSLLIVATSY